MQRRISHSISLCALTWFSHLTVTRGEDGTSAPESLLVEPGRECHSCHGRYEQGIGARYGVMDKSGSSGMVRQVLMLFLLLDISVCPMRSCPSALSRHRLRFGDFVADCNWTGEAVTITARLISSCNLCSALKLYFWGLC